MTIGLEISIEKTMENDAVVEYRFFVREGRGGLAVPDATGRAGGAQLEKGTGEVRLVQECADDREGIIFPRVVAVLKRHWKAGEYPQVTWWAA